MSHHDFLAVCHVTFDVNFRYPRERALLMKSTHFMDSTRGDAWNEHPLFLMIAKLPEVFLYSYRLEICCAFSRNYSWDELSLWCLACGNAGQAQILPCHWEWPRRKLDLFIAHVYGKYWPADATANVQHARSLKMLMVRGMYSEKLTLIALQIPCLCSSHYSTCRVKQQCGITVWKTP